MLKNAKLYEDEIREGMRDTWYDLKYQYVNGWSGCNDFTVGDDNYEKHVFASVDENGNLIGCVGYQVDWASRSACGYFALSFIEGGSIIFAKDLLQVVDNIFNKYNFQRMDWCCWADNPAIRGYRKFCKRFGGRETGILKRKSILMDGKLHDSVSFELLAEDYRNAIEHRRQNK